MTTYKAFIKGQHSNSLIQGATCVLGISLGQPAHENGQLSATLKLLMEQGIARVIILLADTLQRHNMLIDIKETDAKIFMPHTQGLGDEWIFRNKPYLEKFCANRYEVVRWNSLYQSPSFNVYENKVQTDYLNNTQGFKTAVDDTVKKFINRMNRQRKNGSRSPLTGEALNHAEQMSKNYIIEECAGMLLLGEQRKNNYFAYPNEPIKAFEKLSEIHLDKGILEYLTVKLKPFKNAPKKSPVTPISVSTEQTMSPVRVIESDQPSPPSPRRSPITFFPSYLVDLSAKMAQQKVDPEWTSKFVLNLLKHSKNSRVEKQIHIEEAEFTPMSTSP